MTKISIIKQAFENGEGVFKLLPNFIPIPFGRAGNRLKLKQDQLFSYGIDRGSIKERWLASTFPFTWDNATENEGLSYVIFGNSDQDKFLLKEAVEILKDQLIGPELFLQYEDWPIHSKFFDYADPLYVHLHLTQDKAQNVKKMGKPEGYYFPAQLNNYRGTQDISYFGLHEDVSKEDILKCISMFSQKPNEIRKYMIPYKLNLDTGWFIPAGVLHAPGSLLTYEPQWNSNASAVFENYLNGEIYPIEYLNGSCPEDRKEDFQYILSLIDWDKNTDKNFKETYSRNSVIIEQNNNLKNEWIIYGNSYFSAKKITIFPKKKIRLVDKGAYGCIFIEGHGKFGTFSAEAPTVIEFGKPTSDEFFVSWETARKGIVIKNQSETENLVFLQHFGPDNTVK